jgi:flavin reductase (DIM6/NTAB) family NADH-FMN oxidoreductase RutF
MVLDPKKVSVAQFQVFLQGAVAPRPIAFASTIDKNGIVNLSPFSFFNCFSLNPPMLIFSPSRRVRDNTTKHTLQNVLEVDEVVINVVNHHIVEQASLASTEYEKGVNEFIKSGLTEISSTLVKPPRVKESPVAFECKVKQVIELGQEAGAGNLIICEVLLAHYDETILNEKGSIDPNKIDLVARMGDNWYCRASGEAIFEIPKPLMKKGIGVDSIPLAIRNSSILTGNNLGRLGNIERLPSSKEIESFKNTPEIQKLLSGLQKFTTEESILKIHQFAQQLLEEGKIEDAWKLLLILDK